MTPDIQEKLITSIPLSLTAIAAVIGAVLGILNRGKIQEVHLLVNSRMDQLLLATKSEGRIAERMDLATGVLPGVTTPVMELAALMVTKTAADTAAALVAAAKKPPIG
jgi:hypothetical protein